MFKNHIQYQKPMAVVLTALILPSLMAIYNFGWRALAVIATCNACVFVGEYLFVRGQNKKVTLAGFVTGTLLALVMPPNIPFWMAAFGSLFAIVLGKMVFGGFGKNIFNPAMVGRCFLYIAFPAAMASTWFGPIQGPGGGLARWTAEQASEPVAEVSVDKEAKIEGVSGATTLAATKKINQAYVKAHKVLATKGALTPELANDRRKAENTIAGAKKALSELDYTRFFLGREAGSLGETSVPAILIGLAYLIYRKAAKWQLVAGPALGIVCGTVLLSALGIIVIPLVDVLLVNLLAGGGLFAITFMTTEPVSAPNHARAIWIYGIIIGVLAVIIRTMSVFNAGFMFSILLANTFAPIIDLACLEYDDWKKAKDPKSE